jgi:hypothetical protein
MVIDENVRRFDVAMDHPVEVGVFESVGNVLDPPN